MSLTSACCSRSCEADITAIFAVCNNLGLAALLLGLPTLASRGATAALGCILGIGVLQGPFMIANHGMAYSWSPPEDSAERPWARFIMRLGRHCSKVIAPTLTPLLAGRYGWRFTARAYGCGCAGFAIVWQLLASSRPPALERPAGDGTKTKVVPASAVSGSGIEDTCGHCVYVPDTPERNGFTPSSVERAKTKTSDVSMLRLLLTPPAQSCMWLQVTHDLIEFQTLGAWTPTYLNQVLGVPLGSVGKYTVWPMLVSLFGKFAIVAWESRMVKSGMDRYRICFEACWLDIFGDLTVALLLVFCSFRLKLRKLSSAIASYSMIGFVSLFTLAPTPLLATIAYCGVSAGSCFDYPGVLANLLGETDLPPVSPSDPFWGWNPS